ncbi:hypothetical protein PSM7751_00946 [Pseudooceanicola marinus]|uniref:DUF3137 domain-containing protein n=1 Tax=Pseudooceanicola marinus TaxID=396013 RepID=A0A1X6YN32_9RHOB|nr:DUF3137 domain-containing protein [Pseudooceanicola marinus]PJE29431.1 hypothetical protein CVM50_13055 [Pseudooceanicola marinus]SLN26111.1 hypothetical protein PSM7751_00946 [Pseudooceanicola marinus]
MVASHFEERAPHEAGFARLFDDEIQPLYRSTRDLAATKARKARLQSRIVLGLGVLAAGTLAVLHPFDGEAPRWIGPVVILVLAGIIAGVIVHQARASFNRRIKEQVAPLLAAHLGVGDFIIRPHRSYLDLHALTDLQILPRFTDVSIEDGMSGRWRDVGYRLAEVTLRKRMPKSKDDHGPRYQTIFKGLVMEVETPVDMPWTIFEAGPLGFLGGFKEKLMSVRGLSPVDYGLGDEAPFRVYSEQPERAQELVPPLFLETLVQIASEQGTEPRRIEAGFRDRTFHLCLRRSEDFLELDAYDTDPQAFAQSCRAALSDMALPRRVIDLLIDGPAQG